MLILPRHFDERIKPPPGTPLDRENPINRGLVLDLPFNENGGAIVNDLSLNGNTGTITGATWVGGKFGPCLYFDGATDYVTVPANGKFDLSKGGSFGGWVFASSAMSGIARVIIAQGTWEAYWGLGYYPDGPEIRLRLGNDGPALTKNITDGWHHLFGTYDGTTAFLYVDGKFAASKARTLTANTGAVYIGGNITGRWFTGQINNIQVFNLVLTAAEVRELCYNSFGRFRRSRIELLAGALGGEAGPTYTGTGGGTATKATASASATYTVPVYTGVGSPSVTKATASASGTFTVPVYAGAGSPSAVKATGAASGTYVAPVYTASGGGTATKAVAAMKDTICVDDMEGDNYWSLCADGPDPVLELSAAQHYAGAKSLHFKGRTTDAAPADEAAAYRQVSWQETPRLTLTGWLYLPNIAHLQAMSFRASLADGTTLYGPELIWDMTAPAAYYRNAAGGYTAVPTLDDIWVAATWTRLQLVLDLETKRYISVTAGGVSADLTGQDLYAVAPTAQSMIELRTGPTTADTNPAEAYLDDVLITAETTATYTVPVYTGIGSPSVTKVTASATGTFTVPVYTGTGNPSVTKPMASAVGFYGLAVYVGSGGGLATKATASAAATYAVPVYVGVGSPSATKATASADGTYAVPVYAGSGSPSVTKATASAAATYTTPIYVGTGSPSAKKLTASAVGTYVGTILIYDIYDLQNMEDDLDGDYALANDIDASPCNPNSPSWDSDEWSGTVGFRPVGSGVNPFTGSLDGQNHKITGLYINRPEDIQTNGLFGVVSGAIISEVGLEELNIIAFNAGGLVCDLYNGSHLSRCYTSGSVVSDYVTGGLVAAIDGNSTVENCYSLCSVTSQITNAGGLIGNIVSGSVDKCFSVGAVTAAMTAGGLVATNSGAVTNSFWDTETSGCANSGGGTGKTTAEMKDDATFTDTDTAGLTTPWDFVGNPHDDVANEDIWNINAAVNGGYPTLYGVAVYTGSGGGAFGKATASASGTFLAAMMTAACAFLLLKRRR